MVTSNKDLMTQARETLSGRWGLVVGTFFVFTLIAGALGGGVVTLLLMGTFMLGIAGFSLAIARKNEAKLDMIFSGFSNFSNALVLYLLRGLFIFLWTLLLIIPGIIAQISYSLAFFILSDEPEIGAMDAINKSKKMMYGYKWKYFCLCCRFIGWFILGVLSCGIGFLWITPYLNISFAKFYEDVKANYVEGQ